LIEISQPELAIYLGAFAFSLWYTWKQAEKSGYQDGYNDACTDVALGNITVTLQESED